MRVWYLLFPILFHIALSQDPHKTLRIPILRALYNNTGGPNWRQSCQFGWSDLTNTDYCQWSGILCYTNDNDTAYSIGLRLQNCGMKGELPASLSKINWQNFNLSDNQLTGKIPQFRLVFRLDLSYNNYSGPIRLENATMKGTQIINLRGNYFSGIWPDNLLTFSALETLDLSYNRLNGIVPLLCNISTHMKYLDMSFNNLTGSIPSCVCDMSRLQTLDLSYNQLNVIPNCWPFFGGELSSLYLQNNAFEGPIPETLVSLWSLETLDLSFNKFSGLMLNFVMPTIVTIRLSNNELSGPIDGASLPIAAIMDFSYNNFSGPLPPELSSSALAIANFQGNPHMRSPYYDSTNGSIDDFLVVVQGETDNDGRVFTCSSFELKDYYGVVLISPSYFNYHQCQCSKGYVGQPPDDCYECPSNCDCASETISWKKGYFPIYSEENNVSYIYACHKCDEVSVDDPQCNPNGNCQAYWAQEPFSNCSLCREGSKGHMCTECQCLSGSDCYFYNNGHCTKCNSPKLIALYFIPVIFFFFVSVGVTVFSLSYKKKGVSLFLRVFRRLMKLYRCIPPGHMKIILVFLQSISAINSMWKTLVMVKISPILSITNINTTGIGLVCIFPFLSDPVKHLIAISVLPIGIILFGIGLAFVLALVLRSPLKRKSLVNSMRRNSFRLSSNSSLEDEFLKVDEYQPSGRERIASMVITCMYFFYFTLSSQTLSVWNCHREEGSGVEYLQTIPWLECSDDTDWKNLKVISYVNMALYVLGIPIVFAVLLAVYRNRSEEKSVRYWLGNTLYRAYRPQMFMFELVIIARRLALAVLLSVFEQGNVFQVTGVYILFLVSLVVQNQIQPYNSSIENKMEELSLITLIFCYAAQITSVFVLEEDADGHDFLAVSTVVISGLVIAGMTVSLFRASLLRILDLKKRKYTLQENKEEIEVDSLVDTDDWKDTTRQERTSLLKEDDTERYF